MPKDWRDNFLEIRNLRIRAKTSYLTMQKLREEKKIVDNKKYS